MAFGPYQFSLTTYGHRPYPETIGLFGQFSTSPAPKPTPLFWAWGVHLAPQALTRAFGPTPLTMGSKAQMAFLGHLGPLKPLQPTVHMSPSISCGPGAKGANNQPPRPGGPTCLILAPISTFPKIDKRTPGP
ncbi:hypothetical protein O181_124031 [Austropuccinia psidii MF-1]|uniref:Uncharacterized protein n=1 Tax=Austropuccinia psidii MF-1 TaxID=1389203 RepID=A0A9Q3Q3T0_9BASI|nr:hypothetical protein [Austropuccinia psidii MF-1]